MYPTLSFALNDLFGINLPLPIQMFGFWVAVAFLLGAWIVKMEFQRMEAAGLLYATRKRVQVGLPPQPVPIVWSGVVGFLLGYKLVYAALNYGAFVANPQEILLSAQGNFLGGLAAAALAAYNNYREQKKLQLPKPKWVEELTHPHDYTGNVIVIAAISGLLGAKVFHNLEYWDELMRDPIDALLSFSGLTFYGGLIVAGIAVWRYTHQLGFRTILVMEVAAPVMALTYGVGRIGCQMSGDGDWGLPAEWAQVPGFLPEWFWQYTYPHNVIKAGVPIMGCEGPYCFQLPEAVYPTPLWESIAGIAVFFLLWALRKRIPVAGTLTGIYLILMGIERFLVEKIRHNSTYSLFGADITQAEIISTVSVLAGLGMLLWVYRHKAQFLFTNIAIEAKERANASTPTQKP